MKVSIAESRFDVNPIGNTCLVIDVLRATSVMAVLLEHGVKQIYLADSIESARDLKANLPLPEEVLMIGERNSLSPRLEISSSKFTRLAPERWKVPLLLHIEEHLLQ